MDDNNHYLLPYEAITEVLMENPMTALDDIASAVSNNVSYATTHFQTLCVIEEPLAQRLATLRSDPAWINDWFKKETFTTRDTFRDACYMIIRNMLFRITKHPEPMQWYYNRDRQKVIFDALWTIDQCSRFLRESESESLSAFAPPFLDKVTDLVEWVLEEYADIPLDPWSFYYTDTDRTTSLRQHAYLLRQGMTNERLMMLLTCRTEILDHLTGNIPPDRQWSEMIKDKGHEALFTLAMSHQAEELEKAASLLHRRLSKEDTA